MNIRPGNAQDIGKREEQQDSFGFSDIDDEGFKAHGGVLLVVADGMGGLDMGREASQLAVNVMLDEYRRKGPDEDIVDVLDRAIDVVNDSVYEMAREAGLAGDVGTTLVAAAVHDNALAWVSVGDSRLYIYRDGELHRISVDHSYSRQLAAMVSEGRISREDALNHPERNALTSYIGIATLRDVDLGEIPIPLQQGDRIVLCSDGLYGALSEEEMLDAMGPDPQASSEKMVAMVLEKDLERQDNVTVAMLDILEVE